VSEQENLQVVQAFYLAFGQGDLAEALNTLADNIRWFIPGPKDAIIFVGRRQGREQVAQLFEKFAEMQEAEEFEPREFIAQGDKVVALGKYRFRVKATGRSYESEWVHVFGISGGKVSDFTEYLDTLAWAAAYQTSR
jgi:ketosteroid isomerase-like protein